MPQPASFGPRRRWPRMATVTLSAVALSLCVPMAPATAGTPEIVRLVTTSGSGNFCAFNSATGELACVADEQDYPAAKRAAGVQPETGGARQPGAIEAQHLLGRFYDDELFLTTHGYIDWFAPSPCSTSSSDTDSSWVDTSAWRSRISSFRGYSNCRIKAWQFTGYSGASVGYSSSTYNVGSLNDHVWSVRFT